MMKKENPHETAMDTLFEEEIPDAAAENLYELMRGKSISLVVSKADDSVEVDCTRKGSITGLAYLALVMGCSDKTTRIASVVGYLFSVFTKPEDEEVLKIILESILASFETEEELETLFNCVLTCRALRDDVLKRVETAMATKETAAAKADKLSVNTPFWIIPSNNTVH